MSKTAWLKANWVPVLDIAKTIMIGILLFIAIFMLGRISDQAHQIKTLSEQNKSLSQQLTTAVGDLKTDSGKKQDKLQAHIDCIITFFGLPNRLDLSIADVCHFLPSGTAAVAPPGVAHSSSPTSSPVFVSPLPSQSARNPDQKQADNPQPTPQPVNVFGVPLCLPLINNICVEH